MQSPGYAQLRPCIAGVWHGTMTCPQMVIECASNTHILTHVAPHVAPDILPDIVHNSVLRLVHDVVVDTEIVYDVEHQCRSTHTTMS